MAEELPAAIPTPFPPELGFLDQDSFYSSQLFETPRAPQTKATSSQRHGSASPSCPQDHPRPIDHLSEDGDYKDLLFTFPRLYSDAAFERDPFSDSRGTPLNPHNTPVSQSGRQSEAGSLGKGKWNVLSPVRLVKQALDRSSDAAASVDYPLASLFNGRKPSWKPPKPPKPSYLSDIDIQVQGETENVRPSYGLQLPKRGENKEPLPELLHQSLPSRRTSRNIGRSTRLSATGQTPGNQPTQRKRSWQTRSIVPCRYFPRPFTKQELEVLGIPLNNPGMPFPAPIPTMDKLPLRRGVIKLDWNQADQFPHDADGSSRIQTNQLTMSKGPRDTLWRLLYNILAQVQLKRIDGGNATFRKPNESVKQSPTVRTAIIVSFNSRFKTRSKISGEVSTAGPIDATYVLRTNFVFPLLLTQHTTLIAAIIRGCVSSRLALMIYIAIRAFIGTIIRWLLSILQIEVAVELRQV